jgi:hypothetical protein
LAQSKRFSSVNLSRVGMHASYNLGLNAMLMPSFFISRFSSALHMDVISSSS